MADKKILGLFKKSSINEKQNKKIVIQDESRKAPEPRNWIEEEEEEGELLVDVYQEQNNIVIRSTVSGVLPGDIDIDINNDMITIRGKRKDMSSVNEGDYFYKNVTGDVFQGQ